ncbi:MAG: hypothetical protein NTV54_13650 [Ignavibacteriales bacterium]|nr:hypothetical protein [Ignavibacteriales bacterium]
MLSRRFIILLLMMPPILSAQNSSPLSVEAHGAFLVPVGALNEWFLPVPGSAGLCIGQRTEGSMLWEGVFEMASFTKPNTKKLYYSTLDVNLKAYGAGVQMRYFVLDNSFPVEPFLNASAILYRWQAERGSMATDTTHTVIVPSLSQADWSMGFHIGAGVEFAPLNGTFLSLQARYAVVLGELWPALALRLEGVSGFQIVSISLGIRQEIEF